MGAHVWITRSPLWAADASTFLPVLYLVMAFVAGVVIIALVQRWRRRASSLGPSASDEMAQYRVLYEQGVISEEEYRRLRATLGVKLRQDIDAPVRPAASPAPAEQSAPSSAEETPPEGDQPPASGIRPS
jgi:hypothetical protein